MGLFRIDLLLANWLPNFTRLDHHHQHQHRGAIAKPIVQHIPRLVMKYNMIKYNFFVPPLCFKIERNIDQYVPFAIIDV